MNCSSSRTALLRAVAGTLLFAGCFSGALSAPCADENECPFGLACFSPTANGTSLCTVSCSTSACPEGACITTGSGQVCAKTCQSSADCPTGTKCQRDANQRLGCWPSDSSLSPLAENLSLSSVRVLKSGQQVTSIRAGDTVTVELLATNTTSATVSQIGVRVESGAASPQLFFGSPCTAASSTNSAVCTVTNAMGTASSCECAPPPSGRSYDHLQSLAPGQTSPVPMMTLKLEARAGTPAQQYPFAVTLKAQDGRSWTGSFSVEVTP